LCIYVPTFLVFSVVPAKAMIAIQEAYVVSKNWMGDPCAPKAFAWEGLDCTTDPPTGTPRITALYVSDIFEGLKK
jgi:hypothetical protein